MGTLGMKQILLQAVVLLIFYCSTTLACKGQLLASGITAEDKRVILIEHNKLRQIVATGRYPGQPGAENMREVVWDDELALRAQQWADNCEFRHDPQRTINRFTMGQNLAVIWSTAPLALDDGDFPSRIQSWFNEVQKYSFGDAWSPKTGHYSQLVWGETSLVGCGYSEYKDAQKYNKLWVCNYGPGGNVVGYNPYEVGKPNCGTYGMRPSAHYQGLCAAPTSPVVGLNTNSIETYEYTQTQNFENKRSNYYYHTTSNYPQQPTTSNTLTSSLPQQATLLSHQQGKQRTQWRPSVRLSTTSTISKARSTGGYSFGTKTHGGSTAYTSEASQYKYKNKLEAYKPSAEEFARAVRKHTLLRTSYNRKQELQLQKQQQQQQQQQEEQQQQEQDQQEQYENTDEQPEVEVIEVEEPQAVTTKAAANGWSLLTWRG